MLDSMNKGRRPKSGEFVRIYLEAGSHSVSSALQFAWPEALRKGRNFIPARWIWRSISSCFAIRLAGFNAALLNLAADPRTHQIEKQVRNGLLLLFLHEQRSVLQLQRYTES
jgi:hypothetical protein